MSSSRNRPVVTALVGATGCGKTEVSLQLAPRLGAEIVCADSRQLFRGLDAATGKPTPEEQRIVPHHLFDCVALTETIHAAEYARRAAVSIREIVARGAVPLLVGGSGFYLQALASGLSEIPAIPSAVRGALVEEWASRGGEALRAELEAVDPESAARIAPGDRQRTLRALEVHRTTGRSLTGWHRAAARSPLEADWIWIHLDRERTDLNRALDRRTRAFFVGDLLTETARHLADGVPAGSAGLRSLAYREAVQLLHGEIEFGDAIERAQRATRRYAKRQRTWWRGQGGGPGFHTLAFGEGDRPETVVDRVETLLRAARTPS